MSNKNLTIWLTVVTIIAVLGLFLPVRLAVAPTAGSSGSRYPNGISADSTSPSAGQVRGTTLTVTGASTLAGAVSVATSSPSALGDVVISGTGTTTLMLGTSAASKGTCLQMLNSAGTLTQVYILGTTFVLAAGSCK